MKIASNKLLACLTIWVIYTIVYGITKNIASLHVYNGFLALLGEAGLDLVCAILAYKVLKNTKHPEKFVFLIFALSFAFGVISDGSYNIILNILGINSFPPALETIFDLPFAAFLLLQTVAWFYIFRLIQKRHAHQLHGLLFLPFIVSGAVIILTFFLLPSWHIRFLSTEGIYNIIDTLLEVISFAFVVICLFSAKNKKLGLLAAGYLIIIASDFVIRFSEVEKILYPGSPLETTWVLGLLLFAAGLINLLNEDNFRFESNMGSWNSLKVQIGYWLFTSCLASVFILLIINTVFANLDIRNVHDIPATLIVFAVLSALVSNIISAYVIRPFKHLNEIVNVYSKHDHSYLEKKRPSINIEEFKQLEECLYDGLKAIKNKSLTERQYLKAVMSYADSVRGPATAIEMLAEDIDELPKDKKTILINSIKDLTTKTDDFLNNFQIEDISKKKPGPDRSKYVVVDDNKNLTMAWEMDAAEVGVDLLACNTPDEFMEKSKTLDHSATIYIDANLDNNISGVELAHWAYDRGFRNLYIITGGDRSKLANTEWVKDVLDKREIPFIK